MKTTSGSSSVLESNGRHQFGELLVNKGMITQDELLGALDEQREKGGRIGEILIRRRILDDLTLSTVLAEHLCMEYIGLDDHSKIDLKVARGLPESIAKRFCLLALREEDGKLVTAMADPLDVVAIDTVMLKMQRPIKPVISAPGEIRRAIELIYHGSDIEERQLRDLVATENDADEEIAANIPAAEGFDGAGGGEEAANQAPVIRFVDLLLRQAVKNRASDIHIEPQADTTIVRIRVDGVLREVVPPPKRMHAAVIARIKILAQMNIAERRLPQDGRLRIRTSGREIDVRVSTIPTIYGEKVVMRILDTAAVSHDLNRLGIEPDAMIELKSMLARPHGIIIVTGPTGSGKSTTLYAALNYLKNPAVNITTVEDPVEYRLAGINQIQVKPEIGLDFALSLRAILRQDPNIILIGEIRDKETVEIAIKASLTGHLVLSTFHTNDAPSAISRLAYMGIERYLLASTLNLIVAQRLVRKICENCKEPARPSDEIVQRLKLDRVKNADATFHRGKGCPICGNTGYHGRLPIFEFLVVDEDIGERIIAGQSEAQIKEAVRAKGYGNLLDSGVQAVLRGLTTPEEVIRVASMGEA
ncbi:MAG TPA: ATPase, T2SS/T4P/T4SS family [Sedimentisphaerales bacterium]|jgi:type IV pilus assembly protein PilB|nr:ATPase, T2SS/T4P/T4SS family [Sedimentisphaerales bacterium]HNU28372.1 ATPase, T2SS/T4P/T4SS family [Sedimentisphaerales bacterium]